MVSSSFMDSFRKCYSIKIFCDTETVHVAKCVHSESRKNSEESENAGKEVISLMFSFLYVHESEIKPMPK
jgi:hypothetical protein